MNKAGRVLVVDDEAMVTRSCKRILAEEGYEVETADNGRDGCSLALSRPYDLVMTDLKMPDMDGMDLIRSLRKQKPRMAVVVITGYSTIPSAVEAVRLGVSDYIEKPFSPREIVDAASRALEPVADAARPARPARIEAGLVREVLSRAARDNAFGAALLASGSGALSRYNLSPEAKAAIASGDEAWISKECGQLSAEERDWLKRRLEAETW